MSYKKIIAVDFDGVLHAYSKGWQNGEIYDDPVPGSAEAMHALLDAGYEVVIFSTRTFNRIFDGRVSENQVGKMAVWLERHNIPFTRIHAEPTKPVATLFIDDRAYRFTGDWNAALPEIQSILLNEK